MKHFKINQLLVVILLLLCCNTMQSQNDFSVNNNDFAFGFGVKFSVEFSPYYPPDYKLGVTAGLSYSTSFSGDRYGITPAIHGGMLFFNRGMVGGDQAAKWSKIQSHAFFNTTAHFQLDRLDFNPLIRPVPMYHFAEFTANPLQNPYKSSVAYGMNLVLVHDQKLQRTGFFNLNVAGRFQISYYNDGGPVLGWAGDNRDRYYTGGLVLSYHGNTNNLVDLVELSYHKFTGYQEYAFDVGDKLQIDFLNYHDTNQFKYNQQRWRLNATSLNSGYGASVSIYNSNILDFQDFLHFATHVPYHPDYFKGYRWMFGGRYEYNQSKL